ncbi:hypothetical protein [Sphingobacterium kitahiroshimense]|uniref:IPT/TIG domain-containing protein n=1 Tax=Sphingobacterium kitahiroshimense TaxID=470446 RepID=A0ABV0BZX6_9SPHI
MKGQHFLRCLVLLFITQISCNKVETIPFEDTRPIQLETHGFEVNQDKKISLTSNILYLNSDKIIEHGFEFLIFDEEYKEKTKTFPVKTEAKIGRVTLTLDESTLKDLGNIQKFRYYIKTSNKDNFGQYLLYFVNQPVDFTVHPNQSVVGYVGDLVTLKGNFKDVSNRYDLYFGDSRDKIPFSVSNSDIDLSFKLPSYKNGESAYVYLVSKADSNHTGRQYVLTEVKFLSRLNPPDSYNIDIYSHLTLSAKEGSAYNSSILIGDKLIPYEVYLRLSDHLRPENGDSYRLGYYNGRDTVIFPQKLQITRPDAKEIYFQTTRVHPLGSTKVLGLHSYKLFGPTSFTLGNHPVQLGFDNQDGSYTLSAGNLPEGEYPLTIKNMNYELITEKKLKVEKLKVTQLSQNSHEMGSPVVISGNFIKGQYYNVDFTGNGIYGIEAEEGKIRFSIPMLKSGEHQVTVGYWNELQSSNIPVQTNFSIQVNPFTYTGFAPLKGSGGTEIRLKGKSIAFATIYLGGNQIHSSQISNTFDEVVVTIPNFLTPGKYKISARLADRWLQVPEIFEVTAL